LITAERLPGLPRTGRLHCSNHDTVGFGQLGSEGPPEMLAQGDPTLLQTMGKQRRLGLMAAGHPPDGADALE
jgi:hypothetical protein